MSTTARPVTPFIDQIVVPSGSWFLRRSGQGVMVSDGVRGWLIPVHNDDYVETVDRALRLFGFELRLAPNLAAYAMQFEQTRVDKFGVMYQLGEN